MSTNVTGQLDHVLDQAADEIAQESWNAEIHRRLRELDSGQQQTISWIEARRQILAD